MNKTLNPFILFLGLISFSLSFQSCEIINPSEDIPFYLRIDSFSFIDSTQNPAIPAKAGSQRIVDAWVFIDNQFVGAYETPITIPVLMSAGNHQVRVYPGILVNGQNINRKRYPFFTSHLQTVNFELGKVDTIIPKVSYDNLVVKYPAEAIGQFPEGFEGAGTIFKISPNSKVDTFYKTDDPALRFDGNFSFMANMNSTDDRLAFETSNEYTLPTNGRNIYMELNYNINTILQIGIYAVDIFSGQVIDVPFINLNPTTGWRKTYLNFTADMAILKNHRFKIYFKAEHNKDLTESKILLDNIRLMYQ